MAKEWEYASLDDVAQDLWEYFLKREHGEKPLLRRCGRHEKVFCVECLRRFQHLDRKLREFAQRRAHGGRVRGVRR